ncbi:MAG: hypothetical protein LBB45_04430 [Methanobrevibacter sp.]|jgi:CRISPR-associated endonuclease Csn1|nr:hypothetical protein [Candidatus Methanovirga basalitermitum]
MEDTTENFMKLMSSEFDLKQKINEHSEHYYALQNYTTPSDFFNSLKIPIPAFLQRSVRQCCHCIDEYIQLVGGGTLPKKIFIETTREDNSKAERDKINKKVNKSRFENLEKLLNDNQELKEELNNYQLHLTEEKFYLYFLQQGKDLYTMEPLSINKLRLYEVDHIIPQSLTLDNSLDNKVLTTHPFNHSENKTDIYPFSHLIKDEVKEF